MQQFTEWLPLSRTVSNVVSVLPKNKPVTASHFAEEILKRHPEYALNAVSGVLPLSETSQQRLPSEWIAEIQSLFSLEQTAMKDAPPSSPVLHGRLALIGLCLLEPELKVQLQKEDFLKNIFLELSESLEEVLTEKGRFLNSTAHLDETVPWDNDADDTMNAPPVIDIPSDSVPNHPDKPMRKLHEDKLGRAAFARFLAKRIIAVPEDSGGYSFHIYGPWGSGKSTLVNFIIEELPKDEWVVTEFNAWRQQHIRPPWWSLLEAMFQKMKKELKCRDLFREYWWRFNTGRTDFMLTLIILAWILALVIVPTVLHGGNNLISYGKAADAISKLFAVLLTIWGIVIAFSRSLLFGSMKAAQTYMEMTQDPMERINSRFVKLIARIRPKRAVVFIDDLDRCQGEYVIEILEGIQTLFRNAPVVFVVTADRKWLNACYEENYQQFKPLVCEPGKPLGVLFLEKVFQFCTPVPGIPRELKEAYWQHLVSVTGQSGEAERQGLLQKAREELKAATSEGSVLNLIDESRNRSFDEQQAIREEAVVRLAAPEIVERTEHALLQYCSFLDPNPRSMKRLVNLYSVNRALATLSHIEITRDRLALWTILSLRWPLVAEFFEKDPIQNYEAFAGKKDDLPIEIMTLSTNKDVIAVLKGGPTEIPLDAATIERCAQLRI